MHNIKAMAFIFIYLQIVRTIFTVFLHAFVLIASILAIYDKGVLVLKLNRQGTVHKQQFYCETLRLFAHI